MAHNFRIMMYKRSVSLHLRLEGDFDGTSAFALPHTIKDWGSHAEKVFIHTDNLREVHPFGMHVFQKHFNDFKKPTHQFVFTGDKAVAIAPPGAPCCAFGRG